MMDEPANRRVIAVIGAGACDRETFRRAETVGRILASERCIVLSGGLGGVMEAASKGAREAGGLVVGILPGSSVAEANPWLDLAIATGLGDARNAILANSAEGFIAVAGSFGTLSEIAFARKRNKPIASLGSWEIDAGVRPVSSPREAVDLVLESLRGG